MHKCRCSALVQQDILVGLPTAGVVTVWYTAAGLGASKSPCLAHL